MNVTEKIVDFSHYRKIKSITNKKGIITLKVLAMVNGKENFLTILMCKDPEEIPLKFGYWIRDNYVRVEKKFGKMPLIEIRSSKNSNNEVFYMDLMLHVQKFSEDLDRVFLIPIVQKVGWKQDKEVE